MIYFLYPEHFPFLIFRLKNGNTGWTEQSPVLFWFTSYRAIAITIFWYAINWEFRIRIGRPKIQNFGMSQLQGRLISKFRNFAFSKNGIWQNGHGMWINWQGEVPNGSGKYKAGKKFRSGGLRQKSASRSGAVPLSTFFGILGLAQWRESTFFPVSKTFRRSAFPVVESNGMEGNVLRGFLANYYNFIENFQFIIRSKLLMRKIILSAFLLFTGISIAQNKNYSEK